MPITVDLKTLPPTIDVAGATAKANKIVSERRRYSVSMSYLAAVRDAQNVIAQCIADDALAGNEPYRPWLAEYLVLCQMRERSMASWTQAEQARIDRLAELAARTAEMCGQS